MALLLLLAGLPVAGPVQATDATADIPGVPLPGPAVSSSLGGTIYDVVYSVDVPAGNVITISLSGSAGTDFDLYLFSSSATTVVNNVGLLASSKGPTSMEHLSYASTVAARYYIDLNGASEVPGTFVLLVQVVPDPTPPIASIAMNDGRAATNNRIVTANLGGYDDLSGVPDMSLSDDGINWTPWLPFAFHPIWTFEAVDGTYTLWARVRNGVGLESAPVSASIRLDTVAPTVLGVTPSQNGTVVGLRPRFTVTFSEPIDPLSWSPYGLILQGGGGGLVPGLSSVDGAGSTGTFVPLADLVPGAAYVVTVGPVRDVAGNPVVPLGSWTVIPLIETSVSGGIAPAVIVFGQSTRLSVRASVPAGEMLTVGSAPTQAGPVADSELLAPVAGLAEIVITPVRNTYYRVSYPGSAVAAGSSFTARVIVRRAVALLGVSSSTAAKAKGGQPVRLTAQVGPSSAGVVISFRLYRYDAAARRYVYAGSRGARTTASGRAAITWTPAAGRWAWRVSVAPNAEFANNLSPLYRWVVAP